jgi:hypothetical protein
MSSGAALPNVATRLFQSRVESAAAAPPAAKMAARQKILGHAFISLSPKQHRRFFFKLQTHRDEVRHYRPLQRHKALFYVAATSVLVTAKEITCR